MSTRRWKLNNDKRFIRGRIKNAQNLTTLTGNIHIRILTSKSLKEIKGGNKKN